MKILLLGPQGSGKSTQGKLLAASLKIPYISTGDMFREIAQEDSEEGKRIKQLQESGQLIDDETTRELIKKRLQRQDTKDGFILDGYPRTSDQVSLFDAIDLKFDRIFYLNVPEEDVVKRLMTRGRSDDTPEAIKVRLDVYKLKTEALKLALEKFGNLFEIDASKSVDEVQAEILERIEN